MPKAGAPNLRTPSNYQVVSPILVGRDPILAALDRGVMAVGTGQGQLITIAGEAGLGKSRLVTEAQRRAAAAGLTVLRGHCFEPDASLPYGPIIDLLRGCIAEHGQHEIVECMGPDAPVIAKILPELCNLIPGLEPVPAVDPEQENRRISQALCQFFQRMSSHGPLLVAIEDLHWGDDASLEFLAVLARRISALPLLVVMTYRHNEEQPPLRQLLAGLARERIGAEWQLGPLSADDVNQIISAIFDLATPARPEFVESMYSLTEGNPFFLEEVLRSLVASGDIFLHEGEWDRKPLGELQIPRSIQAAVSARTSQLGPEARDVLKVAAVAGRRFDFALLQRLTSHNEGALLALIKELIAAQFVAEESAEHFSFRHALTQQAISTELLARERRSMHFTIAETMRDLYASEIEARLPDLAHHFYAAEAWDEAYYYCLRVGERAQTLNAARAADQHFGRAIEAATHLRVATPASLFHARGHALETLGDFDGARSHYEQGLALAQTAEDGDAEWQSLIDLGFLWAVRDYERTGTYFQRASDLAERSGNARLQAGSLNRLGNWLVNIGRPREGLERHEAALAIFEDQGDEAGAGETFDLIGMASGILGDLPASHLALSRAIALLRQLGPSAALSSSLASRAIYSGPAMAEAVIAAPGELQGVLNDANEAAAIADEIGSPTARAYACWCGGAAAAGFGDLGEGLRRASEGLQLATEIGHDQWITGARYTLGQIHIYGLAPDRAIDQLQSALRLARDLGSAWWIGNVTACLGLAHLMERDPKAAESALASVIAPDRVPENLPERRMLWVWGLVSLAQGKADLALRAADRLHPAVGQSDGGRPVPSLLQLRGDALCALHRHDEALAALEQARDGAIRRGARPILWQIHCSLGRLHQARRSPQEAAAAFADARTEVGLLAGTIDDPALREQFERAASAALPRPRAVTANQAAKDAFGGLTSREREVASLVAEGLTNRDIAERLVLGERTIETHVGNVLSKLGFSSRAQVAAWAVQAGLARPAPHP